MISREDIAFILSHFDSVLFPRKMMTLISNGQFTVHSLEEILLRCKQSGFIDCRINAYSEYTEYKGIVRQPPNFVFIDLDLGNFEMDRKKLELGLKRTLKKIGEYKGVPTVLWTGNGYHIYIPIKAIVLDQESIFSKDAFPNLFSISGKYSNWSVSEVFLKYAEIFFTNGKADPLHRPKYNSCLIRIPNTINSKLLNKGFGREGSIVKGIQKWNGNRIPIQYLLKNFRRWLVQEEYNQRIVNNERKHFKPVARLSNTYSWIENLLQTPLDDYRKYCLRCILVPYLINIKNLSHDESANLLKYWLSKCDDMRSLDFNMDLEIKNLIKYVKNFKPLGLVRLKEVNPQLYDILNSKDILGVRSIFYRK